MKTLHVGELKAHFSEVLQEVEQGKAVAVGYGRKSKRVAVIVPYDEYIATEQQRKLGVLENKGSYSFSPDFDLNDEELLES